MTKAWTCPAGPSDGKNQGILPKGSLLAFFLRSTVQFHAFVIGIDIISFPLRPKLTSDCLADEQI